MRSLIVFVVIVSAVIAFDSGIAAVRWESYKARFNKQYEGILDSQRFQIYKKNLQKINELNELNGEPAYGENIFTDVDPVEFRKTHLMGPRNKNTTTSASYPTFAPRTDACTSNAECDWTKKGPATSPMKDQGQCGSCWAESLVEAIETANYFAGKKLTPLAVQQVVSCDTGSGDFGCSGGDPPNGYKYVINAGGLEAETDYAYTAQDDPCKADPSKFIQTLSDFKFAVPECHGACDEQGKYAKQAHAYIRDYGPLSICINATPLQFYTGGIIKDNCGHAETDIDHCVHLVGYGTDKLSGDIYWIVKNSWGEYWGDLGFCKMLASEANVCAVLNEMTYAIV